MPAFHLLINTLLREYGKTMTTKDKIDSITKNLKDLLSNNVGTTVSSIQFDGDIVGKGLQWTGSGHIKQIVFNTNPDRLCSSESIDIAGNKSLLIGGDVVLSGTALGDTVKHSNLTQLGILEGLLVEGSVSINQYVYFDSQTNNLGFGTPNPKAQISIVDKSRETALDKGKVGTISKDNFDIVTNNISRINVAASGDIQFGNPNQPLSKVSVHGQLAIKVTNPDPEVDLHVNGSVRFSGHLQKYGSYPPTSGYHSVGDIIWNDQPKIDSYAGWICINAGDPGRWEPFGKIGNQ